MLKNSRIKLSLKLIPNNTILKSSSLAEISYLFTSIIPLLDSNCHLKITTGQWHAEPIKEVYSSGSTSSVLNFLKQSVLIICPMTGLWDQLWVYSDEACLIENRKT